MERGTAVCKKFLTIILQVCILYVFLFIGNAIHNLFHLSIPGSIIALLLLFISLCLKIIPLKLVEQGAGFLLSILTLFFIPATVGIMNHPSLFSLQGVLLLVAILISTIISMIIAGTTSQLFEHKRNIKKG